MNEIEKLIKELCPDGVEFKSIEEVANVGTGRSDRKDAVGNGEYPFYVRSQDILRINSYEFDEEAIIIPGEGGIGEIFHYVNEKYALHQRAYRINFFDKRVNTKFAYYYFIAGFKTFILSKAVSATVTSIRKPMITKFKIPVPPLEVQEKIVKVLDKMTQLEAALEAELSLRRQQYEYYRNALLTFDLNGGGSYNPLWARILELCPDGVEFREVQELFELKTGYTPSTKNQEFWQDGTIPWFRLEDIRTNGRILDFALQSVSESAVKGKGVYPSNSLIVSTLATIGEHALIKVPFLANQQLTVLILKDQFKEQLNMHFAYYYAFLLGDWCKKNVRQASFASVDMTGFRKFKFPVPPLEIQEQIVEILDKFDKLTNDLTEGLPAEIEARRQQYEYYRNRLLSFPEKTAKFS